MCKSRKSNDARERHALQLQCFFVRLVCFKRGAALNVSQGGGLNAFKVYIAAVCLSCVNQDTLYDVQSKGNRDTLYF